MSELPEHVPPAPVPEPRDSALGIVMRRAAGGEWELLFGLRSRKSRFMPENLAFPGGKFEDEDGPPGLPALARCASREMLEETGVLVPPERWLDAGERTTPPIFAVRFRTRFFATEAPRDLALPAEPPRPDEIERLVFATPERVLADWERGAAAVPPPLIPILRALAAEPGLDVPGFARRIAALNAAEDPLPRIEFVPGIWVLPVRTATLPPASHTNVWMPGGARFAVVDPGSDEPEEQERLLAVIRRRIATGEAPESVVVTHHHRDHVGGVARIAGELGVPVRAHPRVLDHLGARLEGISTTPLADGDRIDLGGSTLAVLHTPGHAPGHLALHDLERNVLISGDLVSGLSTILVGLADGDMDQYLASLARARDLGCRLLLPSHGPPLPPRAIEATIAHRGEREARVAEALARGARPLQDVALEAYRDTPDAPSFLREMQTRAHLVRLARLGRARRAAGEGECWEPI